MANSGSADKKPGKGTMSIILTLLLIVLVIVAVLGGSFYLIIHNNINGLGDRYRSSLKNIPVLSGALPKAPDPLDPKYMSNSQIKNKYLEYRKSTDDLKKQLNDATKKLAELEKYKADSEKAFAGIKDQQAAVDARQKQLDDLKKTVDGLIANGDKTGFKQYYDSVDPATAKEVYAQIVKQQQADKNMAQLAQIYEVMDASAAAQIFEQMGASKLDTIASILKNMKKENSAAILAAMTPDFAAKAADKLEALINGKPGG